MEYEKHNFKKYFSYRELWERPYQVSPYKTVMTNCFQIYYHDKINNDTHIVYATSELACWRIIDLAIFMLRYDSGEMDLEFPERHITLEKKAFKLAFGNDYYDARRFINNYK